MNILRISPETRFESASVKFTGASFDSEDFTDCECWVLHDGAAGHRSQATGLAQAAGLPFSEFPCRLRFPWKAVWPTGWIPAVNQFENAGWMRTAGPPRLIISCGRQAMLAARLFKRRWGGHVQTVHLQDTRIGPAGFDLVVVPEHDRLRGPNVFVTQGAMHPLNAEVLAAVAQENCPYAKINTGDGPLVAVLLGGPNKYYRFTVESLAPLRQSLRELSDREGARIAVIPSRRTPVEVTEAFQSALGGDQFVWDGQSFNPYRYCLARCSHVIVTADSVSMLSEAAATGKPVFTAGLPLKRKAARFAAFHESFQRSGISRPFTGALAEWSYADPNPTPRIAELIRTQLLLRRRAA